MKHRIMLLTALLFSGITHAAVTELSDTQLSQINGKGNGLVTNPLFPIPKPTTPTNPWAGIKFPKYSSLTLTNSGSIKKPLEGFDTITGTNFVGMHYMNMIHNFGVDEDSRNYVLHSQDFVNGPTTITDTGDGKKYSVVGDVSRYARTTEGRFEAAKSSVVEEYYRVVNTDGTLSNQALRWTKWNRDINMTKW